MTPSPSPSSETSPPPSEDSEFALSAKEETATDLLKTVVLAVLLALFIRTFFYEPFNIPSGSMLPTLQIGDYLFVNKLSYGYSQYSVPFGGGSFEGRMFEKAPERGDVVVFRQPPHPEIDFIKRIIGLPGDQIQVLQGRLFINGRLVEREAIGPKTLSAQEGGRETVVGYIETLPEGRRHLIYEVSDEELLDNTPLYTVPEGHYFVMGDNRDNSQDSRVSAAVGFVPSENLIGQAKIIFFSFANTATFYKPWTWLSALRLDRFFKSIGKEPSLEEEKKLLAAEHAA